MMASLNSSGRPKIPKVARILDEKPPFYFWPQKMQKNARILEEELPFISSHPEKTTKNIRTLDWRVTSTPTLYPFDVTNMTKVISPIQVKCLLCYKIFYVELKNASSVTFLLLRP